MKPNHICNYAVLRFLPYPETGEFVNVGVVLHDADRRWCAHAGDENDVLRVTQFFPSVAAEEYLLQRAAMFAEMERVAALIGRTQDQRQGKSIFQELVRPRESVFRFSEVRTAITAYPYDLLQQLCQQHVKASLKPAELAAA